MSEQGYASTGRETFTEKALTALCTPIWCNMFYIQPNAEGALAIAFGSAQQFTRPDGAQGGYGNVTSAIHISRDTALWLAAYIEHFANLRPEEVATLRETTFPPEKV